MKLPQTGKSWLLSIGRLTVVIVFVSLGLALAGEFEAMLAWWIVIALLLPPLWWTWKTPYIALRTVCVIAFLTQFITVPTFYVYRDDFAFGGVKPFNFTAGEAFPILAKVLLFLLALRVFFRRAYEATIIGGRPPNLTANQMSRSLHDYYKKIAYKTATVRQRNFPFGLLIILVLMTLAPINVWMYSEGIGLTGVAPPRLPYRLSGILHYSTHYIAPALLGYLYSRSAKRWPLIFLLLVYALLLGVSSVSRSAVMFILIPILGLGWLEKRYIMLIMVGFVALFWVGIVSESRRYVHFSSNGISGGDVSLGLYLLVYNILTDSNSDIWRWDFLILAISGLFGRIEGFHNLVMAQFYDPDRVCGAFGFVLGMIGWGLVPSYSVDLHHIQWQGYILPEGFYNGGALLSNAVLLGNSNPAWIVVSAMVAAIALAFLEKSTKRMLMKYNSNLILDVPIISVLTLFYFLDSGGTALFVVPVMLIYAASIMPPVFTKRSTHDVR